MHMYYKGWNTFSGGLWDPLNPINGPLFPGVMDLMLKQNKATLWNNQHLMRAYYAPGPVLNNSYTL